jgi:hypothetical protein
MLILFMTAYTGNMAVEDVEEVEKEVVEKHNMYGIVNVQILEVVQCMQPVTVQDIVRSQSDPQEPGVTVGMGTYVCCCYCCCCHDLAVIIITSSIFTIEVTWIGTLVLIPPLLHPTSNFHYLTNSISRSTLLHRITSTDKTALRDFTASAVSAVNAALLSTVSYDLLTAGTSVLSHSLDVAKEFESKVRNNSIQFSSIYSPDEVRALSFFNDSRFWNKFHALYLEFEFC